MAYAKLWNEVNTPKNWGDAQKYHCTNCWNNANCTMTWANRFWKFTTHNNDHRYWALCWDCYNMMGYTEY